VKQLRQLALWAIAAVLVVIAKWGAYRFVPSPYADIAFLVAGIAIVCVAIIAVTLSFEYVAQPSAPTSSEDGR
jgi:hypothetical protein